MPVKQHIYIFYKFSIWNFLDFVIWLAPERMVWDQAGPCPTSLEEQVARLFRMGPGDAGYAEILALAGSLDRECSRFWAGEMADQA